VAIGKRIYGDGNKSNRLVNPDDTGNVAISILTIPDPDNSGGGFFGSFEGLWFCQGVSDSWP